MLDLKELSKKLNIALDNETKESLSNWVKAKTMNWVKAKDKLPSKEVGNLSYCVFIVNSQGQIWHAYYDYDANKFYMVKTNDEIHDVVYWVHEKQIPIPKL